MKEEAYILGTDPDELHRLGLQHQIWASEAHEGWTRAGFTSGHHLLDLGCGPGFCTRELAYLTGESGHVLGVDRSENYIRFLDAESELHQLNISAVCSDFDRLELEANSLDGIYCRWALAWVPNPGEVIRKMYHALRPGGKMVIHEYYHWATHLTEPALPHIQHAIGQCLKSFKEQPGDIDVGRFLPDLMRETGFVIGSTRSIHKLTRPHEATWQWPRSFYNVYFPKLVEMGYLTEVQMNAAFDDIAELESMPHATLSCPMVIEIIAEKK